MTGSAFDPDPSSERGTEEVMAENRRLRLEIDDLRFHLNESQARSKRLQDDLIACHRELGRAQADENELAQLRRVVEEESARQELDRVRSSVFRSFRARIRS